MAPSSPPASDQSLNHPTSPSPSSDPRHTPASSEPQTSNMSSVEEESVSIASASALESNESTQAWFPFLSLPPEIRNMIYHYIFTPVRDETCRVIYKPHSDGYLVGVRRRCHLTGAEHITCRASYNYIEGYVQVLQIMDAYAHSGILRTCRMILEEAMPISLANMHITIGSSSCCDFGSLISKTLQTLFSNMCQPQGGFVSTITYTYFGTLSGHMAFLAQCINPTGIKIGHLVLHETTSTLDHEVIKHFIANLDSLKHKPSRVEWLHRYTHVSYRYEKCRTEFNEAAQRWLVQLATTKAADCNARLPLLQDFLPQYFDKSSD
ncbi:hypothetical protein KCU67_g9216, partial [Aureobasidium melanogenum]